MRSFARRKRRAWARNAGIVGAVMLASVAVLVLPDLRRYLRIRNM